MSNQNDYVAVMPFTKIGEDERGDTAVFSLSRSQQSFVFLTRKSGSLSGNTYHEGKNQGTSPKIFVLLNGKIKFSYRHVDDDRVFDRIIDEPSLIQVQPLVTHKVEVLEDAIFLECNSINDIRDDRVRLEV